MPAAAGTLAAYRPALGVIAGVAVLGLAVTLTGLRSARPRPVVAPVPVEHDEAELEAVGH